MGKLVEELERPFSQAFVEWQRGIGGQNEAVLIRLASETLVATREFTREGCDGTWLKNLFAHAGIPGPLRLNDQRISCELSVSGRGTEPSACGKK